MCGITGFINHRDKIKDVENELVHRGPDDKGIYSDERINLIHTRLSVLDLTHAGHQPMFYSEECGASSQKHNPKQELYITERFTISRRLDPFYKAKAIHLHLKAIQSLYWHLIWNGAQNVQKGSTVCGLFVFMIK
jgi:hypothetical protein